MSNARADALNLVLCQWHRKQKMKRPEAGDGLIFSMFRRSVVLWKSQPGPFWIDFYH